MISFTFVAAADEVGSIPLIAAIEQNGGILDIVDGVAYLEKAPFSLVFALELGESVLVNVSPSPRAYDIASGQGSIAEIIEADGRWMGGAEAPNNARRFFDLKPDETSWQVWFLEDTFESFDHISPQSDFYLCTRTIENFTVGFGEAVPIEELSADELFVVLVDLEISSDYTVFTELRSVILRLIFIS